MYKLLNYKKGDSIAVGLERPKSTALFFDKLWIPSDFRHSKEGHLLGYDKVPINICIIEEIEEGIYRTDNLPFPFKPSKNSKKIKRVNEKIKIMPYMGQNRPFLTVEEDVLGLEFLFSQNRNLGLKNVANSFKRIYNLDIVPIFVGKTSFEESILMHDEETFNLQLARYHHSKLINKTLPRNLFPIPDLNEFCEKETCNAYEIIINHIPSIVEKELSWNQVLEIRKDKASIQKLRRLRNWVDADLTGKSKEQITATIYQALDDYKFALKKHGIMTVIGSVGTLLSSSASILQAIPEGFNELLPAGLVISAGLITYTATQLSNYFKNRRDPIAFIYDIENKKSC